ncbi:MAG: hypothetical protein SGJ27_02485 [Candidatus Melainabacteria bacterium]|nr:hypothetical protein [Candidatus Melainabacteria bacterium]
MSSINPEMLKQLLSEFEEKQAVCREEIIEINNQIQELEQRIESSKERLSSVARDREKIGSMKQRYQDGDWSAVLSQIAKPATNGDGLTTKIALPEPNAQTGDYPAISIPSKTDAPPANLAPQPVISPPAAQEFPPSFGSEPIPQAAPAAPEVAAPMPDFSQAVAAESAPVNPFEQAPSIPSPTQAPFQMEAPNWETPLPYQPEAVPAQAQAPAAPPAPNEGLFPFSGQVQADAAGGADIPWAPPPTMTWESVGNHTFPNQGAPDPGQQFQQQQQQQQQAQPPAFQNAPPSFPDSSQFGNMPFGQGAEAVPPGNFGDPSQGGPPGPPGAFMSPPPGPSPNPAVLTTAFDEEFDISDALRGDDDNASPDSRDNDKKIKDALRGLFS